MINVERTSKQLNKVTFPDWRNLIKPLSLKLEHLDKFKFFKENRYVEVAKAFKVSLVMSVQLKLRLSNDFIVELLIN